MEVRAIYKYAKISPFKAREVTREIQGLPVSAALDIVAYSPKKAAALVNKTLKSATQHKFHHSTGASQQNSQHSFSQNIKGRNTKTRCSNF